MAVKKLIIYKDSPMLDRRFFTVPVDSEGKVVADSMYYSPAPTFNGEGFVVYQDPFGNCQTECLAYANAAISKGKEFFMKLLDRLYVQTGKPQIMLDVQNIYMATLEEWFTPSQFLVKAPYTNNTGSKMTICLIKFKS